jgi:hypothetical protein
MKTASTSTVSSGCCQRGQCGVYDKRHRFAYAGEDNHYTAGSKRFIASVNGWRINLQVCYDLRFPVWARQQFTEEGLNTMWLIYVANWPERRATAWKALLQARAVENQCYVVGVNRTGTDGNGIYHSGDSRVIDPLGEILYERAHDTDVFTITLDRSHLDTVREKTTVLEGFRRVSTAPLTEGNRAHPVSIGSIDTLTGNLLPRRIQAHRHPQPFHPKRRGQRVPHHIVLLADPDLPSHAVGQGVAAPAHGARIAHGGFLPDQLKRLLSLVIAVVADGSTVGPAKTSG